MTHERTKEKQGDKQKKVEKTLKDFEPMYACRFHPTDWFHEVGCPHMKWTKAQLQKALDDAKRSNAYSFYLRDKSL